MPAHPQCSIDTARPVTPLSIVAHRLEVLCARTEERPAVDAAFSRLLSDTAAVAGGLDAYLAVCTTPASDDLQHLSATTAQLDWGRLHAAGETSLALEQEMLSGHVEGQFLKMLVAATGAREVLEIGLFTGYSALAMAEGLPDDGRLVACEIDRYAATVARRFFDRSAHGHKIRIELGPAIESLQRLIEAGRRFDFVFIDADKGRYAAYFDVIVGSGLLAPRGLMCIDNTLLQGEPYLPGTRSANGEAIADFNRMVAADPRVEQVLLPLRDGVTLVRRA